MLLTIAAAFFEGRRGQFELLVSRPSLQIFEFLELKYNHYYHYSLCRVYLALFWLAYHYSLDRVYLALLLLADHCWLVMAYLALFWVAYHCLLVRT